MAMFPIPFAGFFVRNRSYVMCLKLLVCCYHWLDLGPRKEVHFSLETTEGVVESTTLLATKTR